MSASLPLHSHNPHPTVVERLAQHLGHALIRWSQRTAAARRARALDRVSERAQQLRRHHEAELRRQDAVLGYLQGPRQY
ncbi:hypothetical protein [Nesterenkonia aerolata]|uniref:Uncharacterized protein n=1 Tax=Nesterenkonia aerolata TaxID=3074079 RepID=A0ABU2DU45_9MICC|nr:hypothetical protein [Nesterenkonia sp. LY-0111]MDR8020032.1 hypothetical protein [Nesterenkonia sp. LY-0111]